MKNGFTLHDDATASPAAEAMLKKAEAIFGFRPNLFRVLAEAPVAGDALATLYPLTVETGLSPIEQQVVFQAINVANSCHYCVPAHTMGSRAAGMPERHIEALRAGRSLDEPKLEALRVFVHTMTVKRGEVMPGEFEAFLRAGWTRQTSLEVVLLLAVKTITNYTNHLAGTPLDEAFAAEAWEPDEVATA